MANSKKTGPMRGIKVRNVDESPYDVDSARLRRYDQRSLIFNRIGSDTHWEGY